MNIEKLFGGITRPFTAKELADTIDLYAHGKMLAQHMMRVVPDGEDRVDAVKSLLHSLALCERGISLSPRCDKQVEMTLGGDAECGPRNSFGERQAVANKMEQEAKALLEKAAYMRR